MRSNKPHKASQLCAQVAETLDQVLGGECGDDVLLGLRVVSVSPAPHSSQLLVVVAPAVSGAVPPPAVVQERLQAAAGRLRSLVAQAITRKRAPRLLFQYVALRGPSHGVPPSSTGNGAWTGLAR